MLRSNRGQVAVEQVLLLPIALAAIIAVIAIAILVLRALLLQHAVMRAARAAATFDDAGIAQEFAAALPPQLFGAGEVRVKGIGTEERLSNEEEGVVSAAALANAALVVSGGGMLLRETPVVPALPPGLSDVVLRGGDEPSLYCRQQGGYGICGAGN